MMCLCAKWCENESWKKWIKKSNKKTYKMKSYVDITFSTFTSNSEKKEENIIIIISSYTITCLCPNDMCVLL